LSCNKVFRLLLILAPVLFSFFVLAHFPSLAFVFCFCCVLRSSSLNKYAVARIIFRAYIHQEQTPVSKHSPPKPVKPQKAGFLQQQVSHRLIAGSSEAVPYKVNNQKVKQTRKSKSYYLRFETCKSFRLLRLACG
jgi:hypothetical protein